VLPPDHFTINNTPKNKMKNTTRQIGLAACSFLVGSLVCFVWLRSHHSSDSSAPRITTSFSLSTDVQPLGPVEFQVASAVAPLNDISINVSTNVAPLGPVDIQVQPLQREFRQ
jgi:hypothetical protein